MKELKTRMENCLPEHILCAVITVDNSQFCSLEQSVMITFIDIEYIFIESLLSSCI
jgi:hypothetical protein